MSPFNLKDKDSVFPMATVMFDVYISVFKLENQLLKLKQNQATNVSYTSEADQNIILSLR